MQTSMSPAGFEPATPASNRPQTLTLDRLATGIGKMSVSVINDEAYEDVFEIPSVNW
jgi:hypothetical protein